MRILHTSDWHLGQRLVNQDRHDEHKAALYWLAKTIVTQNVEVLLVAGDIFDTINPSHEARKLYFEFLAAIVKSSSCRHIVVTGGNHDSALMLNASKQLVSLLNIWVVGEATRPITDEVIYLKNDQNETELIVAAVPFLRERDLRAAVAGETTADRITAIRTGIAAHYQTLADEIAAKNLENAPVVAMGHLCVTNTKDNKEQPSAIYARSLDNIEGDTFSSVFNYVALGHIHLPQAVNTAKTARYSGSIIPLSFTEYRDEKSVVLIDFDKKNKGLIPVTQLLPIPTFRKLRRLQGTMDELKTQLAALQPAREGVTSWVEISILTDKILVNPQQDLTDFVANLPVDILKCRIEQIGETPSLLTTETTSQSLLAELRTEDVFEQLLAASSLNDDEKKITYQAFLELYDASNAG